MVLGSFFMLSHAEATLLSISPAVMFLYNSLRSLHVNFMN